MCPLGVFISAVPADSHNFDPLGNILESGGIFDGRALRGVQVELEFHNVATPLANDVLVPRLVDDRLEMRMFLVKSMILYKSLRLQQRQRPIHRGQTDSRIDRSGPTVYFIGVGMGPSLIHYRSDQLTLLCYPHP